MNWKPMKVDNLKPHSLVSTPTTNYEIWDLGKGKIKVEQYFKNITETGMKWGAPTNITAGYFRTIKEAKNWIKKQEAKTST